MTFWPLCCLSFDLRIMITPLVSSNSSYKTKCKQRWSTIPPISTKWATISSNNWTVKKKSTYGVENPGRGLGQVPICGCVIPVLCILLLLYCSIVWLWLWCFTCYFWDTRVFLLTGISYIPHIGGAIVSMFTWSVVYSGACSPRVWYIVEHVHLECGI